MRLWRWGRDECSRAELNCYEQPSDLWRWYHENRNTRGLQERPGQGAERDPGARLPSASLQDQEIRTKPFAQRGDFGRRIPLQDMRLQRDLTFRALVADRLVQLTPGAVTTLDRGRLRLRSQ